VKLLLQVLAIVSALILKFVEASQKKAEMNYKNWRNGYELRKARRIDRASLNKSAELCAKNSRTPKAP
jgi:hypothetical protein